MTLTIDIAAETQSDAIRSLDLSVFTDADLVNLILQRSEVMFDIPRSGRIIRAWNAGDDAPIHEVVATMGTEIARRAAAVIHAEYRSLAPQLKASSPGKIADIGCGYGLFDLFAARDSDAAIVLIDIEQNTRRHFGFAKEGAAYSNLSIARRLLEANGIAPDRIETLNPETDPLASLSGVDMAISFLSCGFHYPVAAYADFFATQVAPGGVIMLDVREATADDQIAFLATLGQVTNLPSPPKARRVLVQKA